MKTKIKLIMTQPQNTNAKIPVPTSIIQSSINSLTFNQDGLIPVITQDYKKHDVLMLAWMNKESIQETLKTGFVHYFSRSRNTLWKKGETSGHLQHLKEMSYDCDSDAILVKVEQIGNIACHTGKRSCFFNQIITI